MKLHRLELTAFGKFSGETLELGEGTGLHVVYGDNEAGKSTALRAIRSLFFGVPAQSQDTFVHPGKDIRIGGEISEGAKRLAFVRRKGRANTLLGTDGQALDDGALLPFLHGVDQPLFDSMFGLDHESLRRGAASLLALEGQLGATLFEAGFGTAHLRGLLASLRTEAEEIFTARSRSKRLNVEIAKVRKAREQVATTATAPQAYLDLRQQLEEVTRALGETNSERRELGRQKQEVELRLRLLPLVAQRNSYHAQAIELGTLPQLPTDAEQRAQALVRDVSTASARREQASRELLRVEKELAAVHVDARQAAVSAGRVEELAERLGSARKAQTDLPKRRAELSSILDEVSRLLGHLGYDPDPSKVGEYRLTKEEETQMRRLVRERTQYDTKVTDSSVKLKQLEASVQALRREQNKLPVETNLRSLESALLRAQKHLTLETQLERSKLDLEAAERKLASVTEELRPFLRAPLDASTAPLSVEEVWGGHRAVSPELSNETGQQLNELRARLVAFEAETTALRERRVELLHRVAAMEGDGSVPSHEHLLELRSVRDDHLMQLEAALTGAKRQSRASDAEASFVQLRQAIVACDEYAERLRHEADRVAEFRGRKEALSELEGRLEVRAESEAALRARLTEAEGAWRSLWQTSALVEGSPRQMTLVLERIHRLEAAEKERAQVLGEVRRIERELSAVVAELSAEMTQLGEQGRLLWESLNQFAARIEGVLHARQLQNEKRRDVQRRLALETEQLENAQRDAAELKEASRAMRSEWPKVCKRLSLNKDAGPEELSAALDGLLDVFRKVEDARGLERRIAGIERDAEKLDGDVRHLASQVYEVVPELPCLELLERLVEDYRRNTAAVAERQRLSAELASRQRQFDQCSFELERDEAALAQLCAAAGVTGSSALFDVIQRVSRQRELLRLRDEEERKIVAQGEGLSLGELVASCEGQHSSSLQVERSQLQERLTALDAQSEQLARERGAIEQRLEQLGEGAARAAEELESEVAALQATVRRYLRLKVATRVLEAEIERYRSVNQGPVLSLARTFFPRLTLGRYAGLSVDYGANDEPLLTCVDADGRHVPVEALSDGTRDQLFLSLRVASLLQYFETNPRLPWVLDDVFVHFDDARASAALALLAEFAERGQVLFFTHHQRMVELARTLPTARVHEHRLGTPSTAPTVN